MKKLILILSLIAALGLIATTGIAGKADMKCSNCPQKIDVAEPAPGNFQDEYAADYAAIEQQLRAKQEEIRAAWSKESTTVGEINRLRNEMLELKKDYLVLSDRVRREFVGSTGETGTGAAGCAKGMWCCDRQGMNERACGKNMKCLGGDDCPKQDCDQTSCKAAEDCPKWERCEMQGRTCRGEEGCRGKGGCPKRS